LDLVLDINKSEESFKKLLSANKVDAVPGWDLIYNEETDYYVK